MIRGQGASSHSSLLSTTLTNPTGAPMTRAGESVPSSSSCLARTRAVGALPMARIKGAPPVSRAAAASTQGTARGTMQGSCRPLISKAASSPRDRLTLRWRWAMDGVGFTAA